MRWIFSSFCKYLKGLLELWFLGDNFLAETFQKYFKKSSHDYYIKENFEVVPFCSSHFSDRNSNALSRLLNSFVQAMNGKFYLPDYIIIMINNDLIDYLQYTRFKVASLYGPWLEYLSEFRTQLLQS